MQKKAINEINMTYGSLFPKIIAFSFPILLTGILQLLYNAADMVVVGQFAGPQALSAVGSTGSITHLLVTCFLGLSVGAGVGISRNYGAKNYESMQRTVSTAFVVSSLSGIFLAVLGIFVSRPLLELMGTPHDVIDAAAIYMKIYFAGMPFNLVYNFGASMLRATGDTKRPLRFLAIAGIVNVSLNLVFVITLNLSVVGVALATIISQLVSAVFVVNCFLKKDSLLKLNLKNLKVHKEELLTIVKIGIPAGLNGAMFSLANVLVQSSVNSFGSLVAAGNVASGNLEGFMLTGMNSVNNAALTSAAQNMGARQYKRMRTGLYYSFVVVVFLAIVMGAFFYLLAEPLISLYNSAPQVVQVGVDRIRFMSLFYLFFGFMDVIVGQLRGMGSSMFPTIVSFCGICLTRVLWIIFVFPLYPFIETVYFIFPVSWAITALIQFILYKIISNRLPKDNLIKN